MMQAGAAERWIFLPCKVHASLPAANVKVSIMYAGGGKGTCVFVCPSLHVFYGHFTLSDDKVLTGDFSCSVKPSPPALVQRVCSQGYQSTLTPALLFVLFVLQCI